MTDHPGPFKCPDCGIWWAGYEHRCQLDLTTAATRITWGTVGPARPTPTVYCNCPDDRGDNYAGNCPIHDVQTTYTV